MFKIHVICFCCTPSLEICSSVREVPTWGLTEVKNGRIFPPKSVYVKFIHIVTFSLLALPPCRLQRIHTVCLQEGQRLEPMEPERAVPHSQCRIPLSACPSLPILRSPCQQAKPSLYGEDGPTADLSVSKSKNANKAEGLRSSAEAETHLEHHVVCPRVDLDIVIRQLQLFAYLVDKLSRIALHLLDLGHEHVATTFPPLIHGEVVGEVACHEVWPALFDLG